VQPARDTAHPLRAAAFSLFRAWTVSQLLHVFCGSGSPCYWPNTAPVRLIAPHAHPCQWVCHLPGNWLDCLQRIRASGAQSSNGAHGVCTAGQRHRSVVVAIVALQREAPGRNDRLFRSHPACAESAPQISQGVWSVEPAPATNGSHASHAVSASPPAAKAKNFGDAGCARRALHRTWSANLP